MTILVVETGLPPDKIAQKCGPTAQWFLDAIAKIGKTAKVVRPYCGETLPLPTSISGAIITGSWSMVTDMEQWSEKTAQWIRQSLQFDIPMLGVCYGHQLMAHALGGIVGNNLYGGEKGTVNITLTELGKNNLILDGFPQNFDAYLFHQQSVLKPPADCEVLAHSDHDGYQMLRYGTSAFSVQFHPEFSADILKAACQETDGEMTSVNCRIAKETPWSRKLLYNFCGIVEDIG